MSFLQSYQVQSEAASVFQPSRSSGFKVLTSRLAF